MSTHPTTRPQFYELFGDDDTVMLDYLSGLTIKNFNDSNDGTGPNTPSSTNASLPTPPALKSTQVFLVKSELVHSTWYPSAPLLKDCDSFTDGTGHSTFDFPIANNNQELDSYPLIYHPPTNNDDDDDDDFGLAASPTQPITYTNSLALDLLPRLDDREVAVRAWIKDVSHQQHSHHELEHQQQQPPPRKRRRSLTASTEADARRVRAWTPTVEPSHAPLLRPSSSRKRAYPSEVDAPD